MLKKILFLILFLFLFTAKAYAVSPITTYALSGSLTAAASSGISFFTLTAQADTITGQNGAGGFITYSSGSFSGSITINGIVFSGSGDTISYNGNSITYDGSTNTFSGSIPLSLTETLTEPATCSDGSAPTGGACSGGAYLTCATSGYALSGSTCSETVSGSFTLSGSSSNIDISGGNSSGSISMTQTESCPTGYDLSSGSCVPSTNSGTASSVFACTPDGINYQDCSSGTVTTVGAPATCPSGTALNANGQCVSTTPATNTCPAGTTYNTANNDCETPSAPSCPSGTSYNTTNKDCEVAGTPTCPSGATYNSTLNECTAAATNTCPTGTTYNTTNKDCEVTYTPSCPAGTTYNSTENMCSAAVSYTCPTGSAYNATAKLCEVSPTTACSVSGTVWNSTENMCSAAATCPSGMTLSGGVCSESSTQSPICPTGTTYKAANNDCEAAPTCPSGTISSSGICTTTTTETAICPSGTAWNSTENMCSAATSCSSGYDNAGNGTCTKTTTVETTPICPNDSEGNATVYNGYVCTETSQATCPANYFYGQYLPAGEGLQSPNEVTGCFQSNMTLGLNELISVSSNPFYILLDSNNTPSPGNNVLYFESNGTFTGNIVDDQGYLTLSGSGSIFSGFTITGYGNDGISGSLTFNLQTGMISGNMTIEGEPMKIAWSPSSEAYAAETANINYGMAFNWVIESNLWSWQNGVTASCPSGTSTVYYNDTWLPDTFIEDCSGTTTVTAPSCPSGTTYNSTDNDCEAAPSCPTGTLNGDTCTSTTSVNACPTGTTYNSTDNMCSAAATCPSGMTLSGGVCSESSTQSPICPTGATYNAANNDCEAAGSVTCSVSGTTYDSTLNECTAAAVVGCPTGTTLNSTNNDCEVAPGNSCPTGTTYNSAENACSAAATQTCPTGTSYDSSQNECTSMPQTPACPSGTAWNSTENMCSAAYAPSCPSGTTYNSTEQMCSAAVTLTCQNGTAPVSGQCLSLSCPNSTPTSAAGELCSFNETPCTQAPPQTPSCPAGTTLDGNQCLSSTAASNTCPTGTAWNSTENMCSVAAVQQCPSGTTYNSGNNDCEAAGTNTCPTGTAWNSAENDCSVAPVQQCPTGTTYNAANNDCEVAGTNISCPTGFTYYTQGMTLTPLADEMQAEYLVIRDTQADIGGDIYWEGIYVNDGANTFYSDYSQYITYENTGQPVTASNLDNELAYIYQLLTGNSDIDANSVAVNYWATQNMTLAEMVMGIYNEIISGSDGYADETYLKNLINSLNDETFTYSCVENTDYTNYACPNGQTTGGAWACPAIQQCSSGTAWNSTENMCSAVAVHPCPTGTTYNAANNDCEAAGSVTCSVSGTTWNSAENMCSASAGHNCPTGTSYNSVNNDCEAAGSSSCPAGSSPSDGQCVSDSCPVCPTGTSLVVTPSDNCPTGTTYNSANNDCEVAGTSACPTGMTLSGGQCVWKTTANLNSGDWTSQSISSPNVPVTAAGVTLTFTVQNTGGLWGYDLRADTSDDTTGIIWWTSDSANCNDFMDTNVSCGTSDYLPAILNTSVNTYTVTVLPNIQTISLNGTEIAGSTSSPTSYINITEIESKGSSVWSNIEISSPPAPTNCPAGTAWNSTENMCSAATVASAECVSPYVCPLSGSPQGQAPGQNYTCVEPSGSSTYYCSPYLCYNDTTNTPVPTTETMPPPQTNNGTMTSSGCSGNIYIFPGQAMQCTRDFALGENCCSHSKFLAGSRNCSSDSQVIAEAIIYDEQYSPPVPVYSGSGDMNTAPITSCSASSIATGCGQQGEAVYIGNYCSLQLPAVGTCLAQTYVFCSFQGLLATIIQAQGRAQLAGGPDAVSWGSVSSPNCTGFTPTQFQELNFSNMNLTEYINVVKNQALNSFTTTQQNTLIQNTTTSIGNEIQTIETGTTP